MDIAIVRQVFGVMLILCGLGFIIQKYRIVIGGTAIQAKVIHFEDIPTARGIDAHRHVVGFTYAGNYLEKPTRSNAFFPKKQIGRNISVYYNEKYPTYVIKKGMGTELGALFFILFGLLLLFAHVL